MDERIQLIGGFWHPKFGLVLYHFGANGEPFIVNIPPIFEENAEQTYEIYVKTSLHLSDLGMGLRSQN